MVNDPSLLMDRSNSIVGPKPVIFRRPTRMIRPSFAYDGLHVARAITYESENAVHISRSLDGYVVGSNKTSDEAPSCAEGVGNASSNYDPVGSSHSPKESCLPNSIDVEDNEKLPSPFELTADVYDTREYTKEDAQSSLSLSSHSTHERDHFESGEEEATLGAIRNAISDSEDGVRPGIKARTVVPQSRTESFVTTQDLSRPLEEGIKEEELIGSDPQLQDDLEMTQEEERRLKAEENHGDRRALVGLQVKDLKGLISEEVAAALKQNTDQVNRDVQKQLEPELRGRLAKAGFLPDLIEAIVKQGNETTTEGEDQPLSNYIRVPTSQLDEATLFHFNVRFKHDIRSQLLDHLPTYDKR